MSTFNKDALRGFIYCLHLQRNTAESAYAKLLEATVQEVFCLEYVQELFKKIEDGEYDMKYEDPKLELSNMPEHINEMIIGNLDFESRQIFRTTSREFRDLVDNSKLHINKFTLRLHECYNELICEDEFRMKYRSLEKLSHVLNVIFQNKKMTINILSVKAPRNWWKLEHFWWVKGDTMELLKKVLTSLKHHVKVETLSMIRIFWIWELEDVLPYLDSNTVKNARIDTEDDEEEGEQYEPKEKLFELEQWKKLEKFKSNHFLNDQKFVEHYSHIPNVKIRLFNRPSIQQVMEMKEMLLKNPKLQQIKIQAKMTPDEFTDVNRELQTFNIAGMANPSWAHFRYPNSPNKRLSLCVTDTMIWFKGPCFVEDEPEEVEPVYSDEESDDDEDDDDDEDEGEDEEEEESDDDDVEDVVGSDAEAEEDSEDTNESNNEGDDDSDEENEQD